LYKIAVIGCNTSDQPVTKLVHAILIVYKGTRQWTTCPAVN